MRAGRTELTRRDIYAGVDRFTQARVCMCVCARACVGGPGPLSPGRFPPPAAPRAPRAAPPRPSPRPTPTPTQPQGELRPALPTGNRLPVLAFAAKEAGVALVASVLRARHGRIEPVERVSIQPKGRSLSRTLFARGT